MPCSLGLSEVFSVDQASFELVVSLLWLPPKTGITGMRLHAWLRTGTIQAVAVSIQN